MRANTCETPGCGNPIEQPPHGKRRFCAECARKRRSAKYWEAKNEALRKSVPDYALVPLHPERPTFHVPFLRRIFAWRWRA